MRIAAIVLAAVLALTAGIVLWRTAATSPDSLASSPSATAPTPTVVATPTSSATPTIAPSTPPGEPSPAPAQPVEEPTGDVADPAGSPPPEPVAAVAADLVDVRLEAGPAGGLDVTFALAGPLPSDAGSLLWSVTLLQGGEQAYTISAQQLGAELVAGVFDWRTQTQTSLPDPAVDDATLRLSVDAALLADLERPFDWHALTQLDGGYEDRLPADGNLTFPP